MMKARSVRLAFASLALISLSTGCERHVADAAAAGSAAGMAYDISTQTRPESVEGYSKFFQGLHQVCAASRQMMGLPAAAPMVVIPANFVTERSSYVSDGKTFLTQHEEFYVDVNEMQPELGCKSRVASAMTAELIKNGTVQVARRDPDSQLEVGPADPLAPPKSGMGQAFSERKTIAGAALRCAPAGATPGPGVAQDLCIPDVAAGVPLDGHGEPVLVHARSTLLQKADIVLLTEPVSVQIGKPVSQARLALPGAK